MKIGIINYTGGGISGGYLKYLQNILPLLAKHTDISSILCATPPNISLENKLGDIKKLEHTDCLPFKYFRLHKDKALYAKLDQFKPDVLFFPLEHFFQYKNIPTVTMIQNMEPLIDNFPGDPVLEKIKKLLQRRAAKKAVMTTDAIIAPSDFVLNFLVDKWHIPKQKITRIYYGINKIEQLSITKPKKIPDSWKNQFIFTVGSIRPARGLDDLVTAIQHQEIKKIDSLYFVIAGKASSATKEYRDNLYNRIKKSSLLNRVSWQSQLTESEMAWCYQNCLTFAITSKIESFGMITGEALSHNCIIVSSDAPCMPEIAKDAAIFYKSGDGKSLADKLIQATHLTTEEKNTIFSRTQARASEFAWQTTAEKTIYLLKSLI